MDFLRGLAPKPHTDTSCAVAVLPSRFAMERPLSAVPAASASVEAIGTESKSQIVDEHRRQTVAQLESDEERRNPGSHDSAEARKQAIAQVIAELQRLHTGR